MIPRIAAGGRSFAGAWNYYGHDKGSKTRERVEWTHTENMLTADADKAVKVMAFTAMEQNRLKEASGVKLTGRKLEKPVFSYSLAWHPEQDPDKEHMLAVALDSIKSLGLEEHEALVVAHRDEPQKHVHVIVNRVHPISGKAATLPNSKRTLSEFARQYERLTGKVYCQQREENHQKRVEGKQTQYRDRDIQDAWNVSRDGPSFQLALEERGFKLAQGRKCVVVIDRHGQIHNPVRHIEGIRARDMRARLLGLDLSRLPDAEELSHQVRGNSREPESPKQEPAREPVRVSEPTPKAEPAPASPPPQVEPSLPTISAGAWNQLQDRHFEERLAVFHRHHQRILRERERLEDYYQVRDQERSIEQLAARKPALWRRLLGITGGKRLEELQAKLDNCRWRVRERVEFLEKDRDRAIAEVARRQEREKELVRKHGLEILNARERAPSMYRPPPGQAPGMSLH